MNPPILFTLLLVAYASYEAWKYFLGAWRNKTHRDRRCESNRVKDPTAATIPAEHNVSCRVKSSAALNPFPSPVDKPDQEQPWSGKDVAAGGGSFTEHSDRRADVTGTIAPSPYGWPVKSAAAPTNSISANVGRGR